MLQKELGAVLDLLLLFKEHIVEGPVRDELGLGVDQVRRGQRVLDIALCFGLHHLVKEVAVDAQLVSHAALVGCIAIVHKLLQVLDVMVKAEQDELDGVQVPIHHLQFNELEVHVGLQDNRVVFIGQVVVVRDGQ